MENNLVGGDVFFLLMGAILVFAMHAGFAFLEVGTVREKNQVNAMVKIISDFAMSTIAYFFIGYSVAYGVDFLAGASVISGGGETETFGPQGLTLIKFFFLLTFAAAIPAIISGGIAERARFVPQLLASGAIVAVVYPFFEGMIWNGNFRFSGMARRKFRRRLSRLCRFGRGARRGRLAGLGRGHYAGRPHRTLWRSRNGVPAFFDPVVGVGQLAFVHWLVRLQRG